MLFLPCLVEGATFTASLGNDTITFGESTTLSLTFSGGTPLSIPTPPEIPGLQIDYIGQSTQISILNGQTTSAVTHNFSVTPRQPGEYTIPALSAEIRGERLSTQPVKLKVLKPGTPSPEALNSGSQLAVLKVSLPKRQLYVGETSAAQLDLYLHNNVHNARNFQLTSTPADGFNIGTLVEHKQRRQIQLGNAIYTVFSFSIPFKVLKAGTLNFGPITANIVVEVPAARPRRDPFFDPLDMFGGPVERRQLVLATESQPVQALDLPRDNVPAGFNGAVGSYTMTYSAGPTNVAVGDPVTLHLQISGRGALDSLTLPEPTGWNDFKVYPPTSKVDTAGDPMGIQGTKTFEQVIVPQSPQIKEVPPISFSFFDPDLKAYRTLSQPPLKLFVRPAGSAPAPTLANANRGNPQETPAPAQDIVPIKTRFQVLAQARPPLIEHAWFLALQGVPLLAWISALVLRKRADTLANNPRLKRQRHVAAVIRQGLRDLHQFAQQNQSDQFFAALFRLLQEQLGERLDVPASSITEAVIEEQLRPRNLPEQTLSQLQELFQLCNLARYAPLKSSQELAALIPKLEAVLKQLEQLQ